MAKRKSTGKRKRFSIFKRDAFTCQYCGQTPPNAVLVIDHILPVAKGGGEDESNLITACETCNQGKADGLLSDVPQPLSESLSQQVERREQFEEYNRWLMAARQRRDKDVYALGVYWCDGYSSPAEAGKWVVKPERLRSISLFADKLPVAQLYNAIDVALSRFPPDRHDDSRAWKYFCGICWRRIRDMDGGSK